jgi:putative ABC transport system substrate-binding protein
MQRILAVAVGHPSTSATAVVRDVIKNKHTNEMRPYVAGLISGLEKLGLKGGQDFDIDYATGEPKRLKQIVKAAIDERRPDAIFAMSTSALKAAMSVTKDIQIVFPSISDPVHDGVAKSCAVPGKNATGVRSMRRQSAHECVELFKTTVPSLRKIFGFHKPTYGPATRAMKALKQAAKAARVTFTPVLVQSHKDIASKLDAIAQSGPAGKPQVGVMVLPDDLVLSAWRSITEIARAKRLPTFFPITDWVTAASPSALAGYGVPQHVGGEAAAAYMYKILHGVPARDLPIKRCGGFEWAVNKAVAEAIGISLPDSVVKAADRVVG